MAHFAELDQNNVVLRVLVVNNVDTMTPQGVEDQQIGITFLKSLFGAETVWIQTSYNANFRGAYAGIGYLYDANQDIFIPPENIIGN